MKDLCEFTWKEISELDKERSIIFITVAPIEEHSLHLPVGTDIYEGEAWIEGAAKKLEELNEGYKCYKLAALPVACARATGFYGCIHYKPKTTYKVVKELLINVASWKFKNIIIVASHGDPIHQIAVEKACKYVNKKFGLCAFSPMGAFFSAEELNIDLKVPDKIKKLENKIHDDYHAGWIETSSMLHINHRLVKDTYKEIPDTHILEKDMISSKKQIRAMGEFGHLGSPRFADEELGVLLNENTSEYLKNAVKCFAQRENYEKYMHHFLYRIPFMHIVFI